MLHELAEKKIETLEIDAIYRPVLTEENITNLVAIQKTILRSYMNKNELVSIETWLDEELQHHLPEIAKVEIEPMRSEALYAINIQAEKQASLQESIKMGRSKEAWFAKEIQEATSHLNINEKVQYLQKLDDTLAQVNQDMYNTIHTTAGNVNQNPHLDGFIAEQHHASTFNMNAEATGSQYRAKVLEPTNGTYNKNSVDIVIVDKNGKVVGRYQSKYCKDSQSTANSFEKGDYRGQQKLVPEDQLTDMNKKSTDVIKAPDGTTSNPLSKVDAKKKQEEAQSGCWNDVNWNDYKTKDIAIGCAKQVGQAALFGIAMGAGMYSLQKIWAQEAFETEEALDVAILVGADSGIKTATAAALKIATEKGIINILPKGTPITVFATIACVVVENVKTVVQIAEGELTFKQGIYKMEETAVSTVAGVLASTSAAVSVGSMVGAVLGPIGVALGTVAGGTIGYMIGAKTGEKFIQTVQKTRDLIIEGVQSMSSTIKSGVNKICNSVLDKISSFF